MSLIEPVVDPLAELAEETVYGRSWAAEPDPERPAPEITAEQTYQAGWCWWPPSVRALEKRARLAGWDVRIGFSRGYKPGRRKGTWALLDLIGVWLSRPGSPRVVFTWERSPDSEGYEWKATTASFRGGNGIRAYKHTEAKALLG